MTAEQAYLKGQEDMKRRVAKDWRGWFTQTVGGQHRLHRLGRKGYHDVPVRIRALKLRPLNRVTDSGGTEQTNSRDPES